MGKSPARASSTAFVLLAWLGMLVWAHVFVATYGLRIPIVDDRWLFDAPPGEVTVWQRLWSLHNEHRLPLPKLVQLGVFRLTGDLRSCMHLQVVVLGAVALAMIAIARYVRGSTRLADAFFPLVWLHIGNRENLLTAFQLAFTMPTALVSLILLAIVASPHPPRVRRAIVCGLALACLPLCGGIGILSAVPLAAWAAWAGLRARSSAEASERAGGRILLGASLLAASLCAIQIAWYQRPAWEYSWSLAHVVWKSAALLAFGLGPAGEASFPTSGALALVLFAATLGLLGTRVLRVPSERTRGGGLLAFVLGSLGLVATMAITRPAGGWESAFAPQYATLTTPALCAAWFAWMALGPPRARVWLPAALCTIAAVALPANARRGREFGEFRRGRAHELEALVRSRAPAPALVDLYTSSFEMSFEESRRVLRALAAARRPPFDVDAAPPPEAFDYLAFRRLPSRVESRSPPSNRRLDGLHAFLVEADSVVHLPLASEDRRATGRFGIPSLLVESGRPGRLRFTVEIAADAAEPRVVHERVLDPLASASDRGPQSFDVAFDVALDVPSPSDHAGPAAELLLRVRALEGGPVGARWSYWSDVAVE